VPLVLERTTALLSRDPDLLGLIELETRALADLPPPFRRIFEVRRTPDSVEVVQERFLGVSGRQLVLALTRQTRLLPLDVWLALAKSLCTGWSGIPRHSPAWRMVPTIDSFGIDLRHRLLIFPEPHHSLGLELARAPAHGVLVTPRWENFSPEHASRADIIDERARVFCLATVLVELLTGERPFRRATALATLQATLTGEPHWRPQHHPDCTETLARALGSALARSPQGRPASLSELSDDLTAAAGVTPAPADRVANVVLGAEFELLRRTLAALRAEPDVLPPSWRTGGLEVLEDELLEGLVPIDELPQSRAPEPSAAAAVPRVNLAGVRRPWWQGLWPFGR
jgi:hypothetical protein